MSAYEKAAKLHATDEQMKEALKSHVKNIQIILQNKAPDALLGDAHIIFCQAIARLEPQIVEDALRVWELTKLKADSEARMEIATILGPSLSEPGNK